MASAFDHAATRRSMVGALAIGVVALPGVVPAAAQTTTPVAGGSVPLLFLQSFATGQLMPSPAGAPYTLTLQHGVGWTLYFSDRPARAGGILPTEQVLDLINADPDNPPNAAVVAERHSRDEASPRIWLVTLLSGAYDPVTVTLTYQARLLAPTDPGWERFSVTPAAPPAAAEALGAGQLFIDPYNSGTIKPVNGNIVTTRN